MSYPNDIIIIDIGNTYFRLGAYGKEGFLPVSFSENSFSTKTMYVKNGASFFAPSTQDQEFHIFHSFRNVLFLSKPDAEKYYSDLGLYGTFKLENNEVTLSSINSGFFLPLKDIFCEFLKAAHTVLCDALNNPEHSCSVAINIPVELSNEQIIQIKDIVNKTLNVPVFFFNEVRALSYYIGNRLNPTSDEFCVVDLGHDHISVSIINKSSETSYTVINSESNFKYGVNGFDQLIASSLTGNFPTVFYDKNPNYSLAMSLLIESVDESIINLCRSEESPLNIQFISEMEQTDRDNPIITRTMLEEIAGVYCNYLKEFIENFLQSINRIPVNNIYITGGGSNLWFLNKLATLLNRNVVCVPKEDSLLCVPIGISVMIQNQIPEGEGSSDSSSSGSETDNIADVNVTTMDQSLTPLIDHIPVPGNDY